MLVLSRKKKQRVVINEGANQIIVEVVEIRGDKIRLGFQAPDHISVHREEVYAAILAERGPLPRAGNHEGTEVKA